MFDALYVGATGMQAQQLNVDTIANNLANVNTVGFKKGRITFTDLMMQEASRITQPGVDSPAGLLGESSRSRTGAGVGIAGIAKLFDMGDLRKTDSAFDVAILGDGFMEVSMPDGSRAYVRGGTLKVNRDGLLSNAAGFPLKPGITVPENTQTLTISSDGHVQVQVMGQSTPTDVGRIELVRFVSPSGLTAMGDNMYRSSDASGDAIVLRAGEEGAGTISQGFLEGSNVKMVDEMVNLMVAQRAYEASSKVVQASDEMLGLINGLRK
jgi:flagellar basal-body rod protein FlgG